MDFQQHDIEAYIVLGDENKRYISGFTGSSSMILILEDKGLFITDGRYISQSKEEVNSFFEIKILKQGMAFNKVVADYLLENNITKIGLDGNHITLTEYKKLVKQIPNVQVKNIPNAMEKIRICKTQEELERIKKAVKITDKTLNYCLKFLKEGITEKDFASKLDYYHIQFGGEKPSFDTIVAFGSHSALPHAKPGIKKLEKGDIIKVDFGCFYEGYCSDMTRTFFFGLPKDEELVKIHQIVLEAHNRQLAALKPKVSTREIDAIGRNYIKEQGYGDKFLHGTGHGIGLEIHESPRLNEVSDVILQEGMVITIEPGIYLEGKGGVRIENDVIITKDGYESLNKTDKSYNLYNNHKI